VRGFGNYPARQVADVLLRQLQRGQERAAPLGKSRNQTLDVVPSGRRQRHRSTSPMIGSMLAMQATTSATTPPSTIRGSACRLANEGARSCTRIGRPEPSLTM